MNLEVFSARPKIRFGSIFLWGFRRVVPLPSPQVFLALAMFLTFSPHHHLRLSHTQPDGRFFASEAFCLPSTPLGHTHLDTGGGVGWVWRAVWRGPLRWWALSLDERPGSRCEWREGRCEADGQAALMSAKASVWMGLMINFLCIPFGTCFLSYFCHFF